MTATGDELWRVHWLPRDEPHGGPRKVQYFRDRRNAIAFARLVGNDGAEVDVDVSAVAFEPTTLRGRRLKYSSSGERRIELWRIRWHYSHWSPSRPPSVRLLAGETWARRAAERLRDRGAVVELSRSDTRVAWVSSPGEM